VVEVGADDDLPAELHDAEVHLLVTAEAPSTAATPSGRVSASRAFQLKQQILNRNTIAEDAIAGLTVDFS
jgi:hypothetical protein